MLRSVPSLNSSMGLQEYLAQVLSPAVPPSHAVPYAESNKWIIKDQLLELQQVFPSLGIRVSDYHANDGRLLHLLKADGTIPIHYQGNKYNIPIVIWLPQRFPDEAPLTYVVPTQTMVIKAGHPHVDRSGQVSCPCLRNWRRHGSNLVELCLELSHVFGSDPPLYSQPAGGSASSPSLAQPPSSAGGSRPVSGPLPTTQPPAGYPMPPGLGGSSSFAGVSPYPYGTQPGPSTSGPSQSVAGQRPGSILAPSGPSGNSSTQGSYSFPTPSPASDLTALAASNPLWGAAFAHSQQSGTSARPSITPPPPPGMGNLSLSGPGTPTEPNRPNTPVQQYPGYGGPPPPPPYSGAHSQPPYSIPPYGPPAPPPPPPQLSRAQVAGTARPLAVQALKKKLEAAHNAWSAHAVSETNRLLEEQRQLLERRSQLQAVLSSLKSERGSTENLVSEMGSKQAQLIAWLERNEPKVAAWKAATKPGQPVQWDAVLPAADELSKQVLETQATDQACEDAVLALDKALQAGLGSITLDQYLKQVRILCRRQYFARALGLKVADMQHHMPAPAARPTPHSGMSRPLAVAHGDTWMHPADAARVAMGP